MRKYGVFLVSIIFILSIGGIAGANTYEYPLGELDDLDHGFFYTVGGNLAIPSDETIVAAILIFHNIRNWDNNTNDLWIHLLDSATPTPSFGFIKTADTRPGDEFSGQAGQVLLVQYHNLSSSAQDFTYNFNAGQLISLISYAADGNVGLGFDPDCHYYNDGLKLTIETSHVPEPATMLLLGLGLVGLAGVRRKLIN